MSTGSPADFLPVRCADDRFECVDVVVSGLRERPAQVFCRDGSGAPVTFGELGRRIAVLQSALDARGLRAGDRVAVMLANEVSHIALIFALILSRLVWVPVNPRLKAEGLRYLLGHSRPNLLITEPALAQGIEPAEQAIPVTTMGDLQEASRVDVPLRLLAGAPGDTLALIYTSGTSGPPKGVIFTHRMLRVASEAVVIVADARDGDRMLFWEPLCHIGGAQLLLLPFLQDVELHLVPRFSASSFWSELAAARATHVHYLGGILDMLAQHPCDVASLSSLRVFWGAAATPAAWRYVRETFGIGLRECYGMTECSSFATVNVDATPMSIGTPLPWIDVELQAEDGSAVAAEEAGEIVLRSAIEGALAAGYLDDDKATRSTMRDGRLHTGDMARRTMGGALQFVGRRSDSMRVRGENVSAWEVERVFAGHPAVELSAAVGVASPLGEQDILLYVKAKPGQALDLPQLRAWGAAQLAPYQLPRYYQQVDGFVTTPSERIRKQFLARDASSAWDAAAVASAAAEPRHR
jgi:crotonobetaine/carnitine-CoA ligase